MPTERAAAMSSIEVERTWLEMRRPPAVAPAPWPDGARLQRALSCPPAFYRFLYGEVGRAYRWVDRLRWSDDALAGHLDDPAVEVWVLYADGVPQGYFELHHVADDRSVEIAYFGLMPWAIGQGLGRRLLEAAIRQAWAGHPHRIWLHTCTLDHPAALPNYLKRGFEVTRIERIVQDLG